VLYSLDEQQLAELPQVTLSNNSIITLVAAARNSAIKRAGSEAAAMQQMQQHTAQAQARYDAQLATAKGRRVRVPLVLQEDEETHLLAKAGQLAVSRLCDCRSAHACVCTDCVACVHRCFRSSAPR
jgi:hypothetical protein